MPGSVLPDEPSRQLTDALPHIVWINDERGTPIYFNRRWLDYTGLDHETTLREGAASAIHPDDRDNVVRSFGAAIERGVEAEAWYRLRRHDGVYRWHRGIVLPLEREHGRVTRWIGTATDADDERRMWDEQRFLAEASAILGTSLDVKQTLGDVGRLVVPRLADWFAIDLLGSDGRIERATVAHVDPTKVALAWEIWKRRPPRPDDPSGAYTVMRTRQPEHHEEIPDELLVQAIDDPELLGIFRGLGLRSSIVVPLVARDTALGTLTMVTAESQRRFGARDVRFAQEVALRISIAVDNARLYTEATRARAAAEAVASEVIEQSRSVEAALLAMRRERDEALGR